MSRAKQQRMCKEDQATMSQIAKVFRIPVTSSVWDWCEVGEKWDDRNDTSENVVVLKLPRRGIAWNLVVSWLTICELSALTELRLDHNNLEGGLPGSMPANLERLYLDHNPKLGGALPQAMKFRKLKVGVRAAWGVERRALVQHGSFGTPPLTASFCFGACRGHGCGGDRYYG